MRNPKTLGAVIILVLLATTIMQIPAYAPIEPTSYKEEECWSGKRCIDPGYYDCIHECLIEAGQPGTCAEAILYITCVVVLYVGETYVLITKTPLPARIKIIIIAASTYAAYYAIKQAYSNCIEAANAALNCIKENCHCPKWEDVMICP